VSCGQKEDQNQDIKLGNRSFENASNFKYLGTSKSMFDSGGN
jgi:hypothetical protein